MVFEEAKGFPLAVSMSEFVIANLLKYEMAENFVERISFGFVFWVLLIGHTKLILYGTFFILIPISHDSLNHGKARHRYRFMFFELHSRPDR